MTAPPYPAPLSAYYAVGTVDLLGQALAVNGPLAQPTCQLSLVLTAQTAPAARTFDPPLTLEVRQTPNGALLIDGRYHVGDGPVRDVPVADGTYSAQVRGDFFRAQPFTLVWPPVAARTPLDPVTGAPLDVGLLPGPLYPYPDLTSTPFNLGPTLLRGAVFTAAGDPVVNATVAFVGLPAFNPANPAWPFVEARTSDSGDWALLLPDRRRFGYPAETTAQAAVVMAISVTYPNGGPVVNIPDVSVTFGRENSLANTALRGVVTRSGGKPRGGIRIRTSVNALESRTRDDGRWSLYFDPNQLDVANVSVTATAADGTNATVAGAAVRKRATVVAPTIHLS
jgi:hypothetical protein